MDLASVISSVAGGGIGSGFSQMGSDLGGGNALAQERAYTAGASAGLELQKKQLAARQARDKAMARDSFMQKYTASHPNATPQEVEFIDNIIQGEMGSDFNSAMTGLKTEQQMRLQRDAAAASDPEAANMVLAAMNGKPRDLTRVSGGTAYDPTRTPTEQGLVITPDAAADNTRQALVADSQVNRNTAAADNSRWRQHAAEVEQEVRHQADVARADGAKISEPQIRELIRTALLNDGKFTIRDEKFSNVAGGVDGQNLPRFGHLSSSQQSPGAGPASTAPALRESSAAVDSSVLQRALDAYNVEGRSKAGIAQKLRDNGYTREADLFERQAK